MDRPSVTERLVGAFAGLVLGAALGALVRMGSESMVFAAAVGGCIGFVIGFCQPNVTTYIFGEFLNPF